MEMKKYSNTSKYYDVRKAWHQKSLEMWSRKPMKRLITIAFFIFGFGVISWIQSDHQSKSDKAHREKLAQAIEAKKKLALAGNGVAATSLGLHYEEIGEQS
jgi:hypothetical protein